MSFDVAGARAAGYSDQEIADYLSSQRKFDAGGARKAGYSDGDIIDHLSKAPAQPNAAPAPRAAAPAAPAKPSILAGAPTKPLAGAGRHDFLGLLEQNADQLYRSYAGAAGDALDGAAGVLNRPANAVLKNLGINYQLPTEQVGSKVPLPVGLPSQFTRGAAPYLFGAGAAGRAIEAAPALVRGAEAAPAAVRAMSPIARGVLAGAPVDAAMSSHQDKNLSNMIADAGGPRLPTARVAGENPGIAALKDMAEGGVVGASLEKAIGLVSHLGAKAPVPDAIPGDPVVLAHADELPPAVAETPAPSPPPAAPAAAEAPPAAVWRTADAEVPVDVIGEPQAAPDGRQYVPVLNKADGRPAFAPVDEIGPGGVPEAPAPEPAAVEPGPTARGVVPVPDEPVAPVPEPAAPEAPVVADEVAPPARPDTPAPPVEAVPSAATVQVPEARASEAGPEPRAVEPAATPEQAPAAEAVPAPVEAAPLPAVEPARAAAADIAPDPKIVAAPAEAPLPATPAPAEKLASSPVAAAPVEGRYGVDEQGLVASDKGGPVRFGTEPQAKKWVANVGEKTGQAFEVAEHPSGGFSAREVPAEVPAPKAEVVLPVADPAHAELSVEKDAPLHEVAAAEPTDKIPEPVGSSAHDMTNEEADALYQKHFGAGRKLYSNPADPELIKEHLVDPAVRVVKKEIEGIKESVEHLRGIGKEAAENFSAKGAADAAGDFVRRLWWTNTASGRAIAHRYKDVPEIAKIVDSIGTDPGRGRVVEQTYERAVQMRAGGMSNRLQNVLGHKVDRALDDRVAEVLSGRRTAVSGSHDEITSRRVRALLDEQHKYMQDAGLEPGYVKGTYFPRVLNSEAVLKSPAVFKDKAAEVYRVMGLGEADAGKAADDWYSRVLGIRDGAYDGSTPFGTRFTKGRTLPPEADTILADFYEKNPRTNLVNYMQATSRAAEFARRFGPNGEKAQEMFNAMLKKGVRPEDVAQVQRNFESATGMLYRTRPGRGAEALGWIQTAGILSLLKGATFSSAVEALSAGVRAHDVGAGFSALVDSYAKVFGLREQDHMDQVTRFLGITGDAVNDMVLSAGFGGEVPGSGMSSRLRRDITSRFFKMSQLEQITQAQRSTVARVGQGFISELFDDVLRGSKRQASAKRLLAELGMDEPTTRATAKWLSEHNGMAPLGELLGEKPEAVAYRTALQRFVDESIQNPTAADRPELAAHPIGRLAYSITSFMMSFTRNVLIRSAREATEGLTGKGYTLEDRARLLTPAIALGILSAAQSQVSELRDETLNPEVKATRSPNQQMITNISRAGLTGNADPFINMAMSYRYQRNMSSLITGPYLSAYLKSFGAMTFALIPKDVKTPVGTFHNIGPNSPNSKNSEWNASKAAYESVITPLLAAAAAYAPGGPVLRAGYGAAFVAGTSSHVARGFADATVGAVPHQKAASTTDDIFAEGDEERDGATN